MDTETLKATLKRELPDLVRADPELRAFILELTRSAYADREQTESRFDRILNELQRDREEQSRKWAAQERQWQEHREEQARKWAAQERKWENNQAELRRMREEQALKWEAQERKWEENQAELRRMREEQALKWEAQERKWEDNQAELKRMREEQALKWEAQERKWEEQNRKWENNHQEIRRLNDALLAQSSRHDRSIGALGARWGLQSERAFRSALAAILEQSFGVEVAHVNEYDASGEVFGRPDQVELDVIVKNGVLIICELKSSMSKSDMYTFERKARFYERLKDRQANRLLVISPMIDHRAVPVAERLGIETYGDSLDVEP